MEYQFNEESKELPLSSPSVGSLESDNASGHFRDDLQDFRTTPHSILSSDLIRGKERNPWDASCCICLVSKGSFPQLTLNYLH